MVLNDIRDSMNYICSKSLKFKDLPWNTHISISTSGDLEHTQEEAGLATSAKKFLDPYTANAVFLQFRRIASDDAVSIWDEQGRSLLTGAEALYDCFMKPVFQMPGITPFIRGLRVCDILFQKFSEMVDSDRFRNSAEEFSNYFGNKTGEILLSISSGEILTYGEYVPPPDGFLSVPIGIPIPVWFQPTVVEFIPHMRLPARFIPLAELGFKVRSLTASLSSFCLIQKSMRHMTQALLARDGRLRVGISVTNKLWSFLKFLGDRVLSHNTFGQSSDYKSATDFIPLVVIQTIWDVFTSYLPVKHPFRVFHRLIYAKKLILTPLDVYPELGFPSFNHECGSFQGDPMSYITLTFMNLLSEVISQKYFDYGKPLFTGLSRAEWESHFVMDPFVIVGDDKLALRQSELRAKYSRDASTGIGFVLSPKDGDSPSVLIFCEDHILLIREDKGKRIVYIDVIKGRLLTNSNRSHSDNRASIFGKGRMLSNQLAYLDEGLRLYILTIHLKIFLRAWGPTFLNQQIPWFLPPNCGGLGLEVVHIPRWGYRYINYIMSVLDIPDWRIRFSILWDLRQLSSRPKHGVVPTHLPLVKAVQALDQIKLSDIPFDSNRVDLAYTQEQIVADMTAKGHPFSNLSPSAYTQDDIINYAWNLGFIPINELIDQFDRIDTFQQMLENPKKTDYRTVTRWVRQSSKFWKKKGLVIGLDEELDPRFPGVNTLEKWVNHHFDAYCSISLSNDIVEFGPHLKIPARRPLAQRNLLLRTQKLGDLFRGLKLPR
jgi:hypothetical protein